ncbi:ribonuclease HI family protein [Arthrobacter cryoconiti]|uniref:Ribonuclease H n=1 Tax=Arthrobacter cryoconiti TaxID=748907 RepID=A0ABV8R4Y2_9MICC|nr:ribonuclease HI family protein [Arthrobacter cryoconiti]MCC9066802.1 ribonuclease HI family protein [Arthrobacter cryoconiti]
MTIVAAADGSALGNPGPAGWAWYVDDSCWRAGGWPHGTNNMGELMAVLDLFRCTAHLPEEPLHILCDSQYVINAVTKWMPGWKRKGWRKADGKPVLNVDLLKDIDAAIAGRKYKFEWVKGHAGHDLNEAADDRARAAATAYQAKQAPPEGPGFPGAELGASATATSAAVTSATATSDVVTSDGPASDTGLPLRSEQKKLAEDSEQLDLFSMLEDDADPAFSQTQDAGLETLVELERELLDPTVRADTIRTGELLHANFEEISASGRRWTRPEILTKLSEEEQRETSLELLSLNRLDTAAVLLTYRSMAAGVSALRSSIWLRENGRWQLRFHQGTPEV